MILHEKSFYTAPLVKSRDNLIEVYSQNGEFIRAFGKPKDRIRNKAQLNHIHLAALDSTVFAAFKYYPIIRRYSKNGALIWEKKLICSNMIGLKNNLNNKRMMNSGGHLIGYSPIFQRMKTCLDKIFILMDGPRIELLQLNSDGDMECIFFMDKEHYAYSVCDFIVTMDRNGHKTFFLLQANPENRIDVALLKGTAVQEKYKTK
jgi:hypothetical protein